MGLSVGTGRLASGEPPGVVGAAGTYWALAFSQVRTFSSGSNAVHAWVLRALLRRPAKGLIEGAVGYVSVSCVGGPVNGPSLPTTLYVPAGTVSRLTGHPGAEVRPAQLTENSTAWFGVNSRTSGSGGP